MTYCPECGSGVAELDIFCPYCGISLKPMPVAADSEGDEFASTIAIASPVSPAIDEPIVGIPDPEPKADPVPTPPTPHLLADLEASLAPSVQHVVDTPEPLVQHPEEVHPVTEDDVSALPFPDEEPVSEPHAEPDLVDGDEEASAEQDVEDFHESSNVPEILTGGDDVADGSLSEIVERENAHGIVDTANEPVSDHPDLLEIGHHLEASEELVHEHFEGSSDELSVDGEIPEASSAEIIDTEDDDKYAVHQELASINEISSESSGDIPSAAPADIDVAASLTDIPVPQETSEPLSDNELNALLSDAYLGAEPIATDSASSDPVTETPLAAEDPEPVKVTADPLESLGEPMGQSASGRVIAATGAMSDSGTGTTDGRKSGLKPLAEGTLLNGRYKISKKIGGGGMGAVYLALDQNLGGTQRAVKEMVQSHIEEEQQAKAIDDFKRESMILSTLDHPAIPTIYDYFYDEAESRFYLVMKYISGGDLAGRLRAAPEGRIDEMTVTEWAVQIIDVLDYLHSLPTTIVYRDLKPSNVMIDGNSGRIMLIDFGIARSINQTQEKGVTAVGTMGYAPPELFSGQVEPRSDIYSLGSTMFHLLTGADPQNNPLLIFDFQKNPRPRQINPRLSDQIERILMRSVEYNADSRFGSAADMKRALQQHVEDLRSGNVTFGITETPAAVSLAFQTVFCGFCGQRIVATDLFCAFCGSKQPIAQQGVHSEIYSAPTGTARLVIEGTSDLSAPAYPLEKIENLVGRRDPMSNIFPEVDLSKYDPQTKISRRHARIWRDGLAFMVEDLGSSNGTILLSRVSDTLRLPPHKPHPIVNGDRLKIGDTTLQFIVG